MKFLLAIGSLGGGGAERVMKWLADSLVSAGHEVTLLTMMGREDDKYQCDTRVQHVSMGGFRRYYNSSRLSVIVNFLRWRRLLIGQCRKVQADVVLSFIDSLNVTCLASLLFSRLPVVVAERSDPALAPLSPLKSLLRPFLYRFRATGVVFQTEVAAERFSAEWRLGKARVIPNAVIEPFATHPVEAGGRVVLSVGRLDPLKGHDILLEAWSRLGPHRDRWTLKIVGDGPERARYETMIHDLGIEDSVELAGFTSDVAAEYGKAAIFVLPSRVEGFPNALLEAMAMGRAVVVSDCPPACREIVAHENNGLHYDGLSGEALAEALKRLIGDSALRARLAEAALDVRTHYSEARAYALWEQCLLEAYT